MGESHEPADVRGVVWANVLALMKERGLNRWQLAQQARLGVASITRLEAQDRDQSLSVFERIARLFGIPLWQLFKPPGAHSAEAQELADLYDACPDENERAKALAIARLVLTGQTPADPVPPSQPSTPVEQHEPALGKPPAVPTRAQLIRS